MQGVRFFRRGCIAPGLSVNLRKGGASLNMAPRGAKVTVGRRGAHGSAGIPGTGVYYTKNRQRARSRTELDTVYPLDPYYRDVASRLGRE